MDKQTTSDWESVRGNKWGIVIKALVERRGKILNTSSSGSSVFFLGNTSIEITKDTLSIGDTKWKLPKPKDEKKK